MLGSAPDTVAEVIFACANQGREGHSKVARMAILRTGLPLESTGYAVNPLGASGLTTILPAAYQIAAEEVDDVIEEGATTISPGGKAERVAAHGGVTREESDAYAMRSHLVAARAAEAGNLSAEAITVKTTSGLIGADEGPRSETTMAQLALPKPSFAAVGRVTAGSSFSLSGGVVVVVVASGQTVRTHGRMPRARRTGSASAWVQPSCLWLGPVPASQKSLARHAKSIRDIDAKKISEAFAPQGISSAWRLRLDKSILNNWGSAIALGHPPGASGVRLALTMARRLEDSHATVGLISLYVGVGRGPSLIMERT